MNDELYEYINKKKQSVVKQYDLLLERIQLSKNPKSAIALMCDEEFIVREPQYPISELLDLMSVFIDEYYKDNELFQDCTKEITDEYITYATEKYSIQFSAPIVLALVAYIHVCENGKKESDCAKNDENIC